MLFVCFGKFMDFDVFVYMVCIVQLVLYLLLYDCVVFEVCVVFFEDLFCVDVDFVGEEFYFFVFEDLLIGKLFGMVSIVVVVGYLELFYVFCNDVLIYVLCELYVNCKIYVFMMLYELIGKSWFVGFYVDLLLCGDVVVYLILCVWMMYIVVNCCCFMLEVFMLLFGVSDGNGVLLFWEVVGCKFFGCNFIDVDIVLGGCSCMFIVEVMLVYLFYVLLLFEVVQCVFGELNEMVLFVYDIYFEEGFELDCFVDIFDVGLVLIVQVDCIVCVKQVLECVVCEVVYQWGDVVYMVLMGSGELFCCVLVDLLGDMVDVCGIDVLLVGDVCVVFDVKEGDVVCCVLLYCCDDEDLKGDVV